MKAFDWTQFSKRIYINSDLESVYNAWTQSSQLERWILSECIFKNSEGTQIDNSHNVESGSTYTWTWYAQNHSEDGKVLETNGKDSLLFTFAGNCKVHVKLVEENNQTIVNIIQSDIPTDDQSMKNIRLGCAFGWSFYLTNLKSILEGGIDLRNKDTSLKRVVNN